MNVKGGNFGYFDPFKLPDLGSAETGDLKAQYRSGPVFGTPRMGDEGGNFYQRCSGFRCRVSGLRCQQLKSTRWMAVAHELDFLPPLVTFSFNPIRVQDSGFVFYSYEKSILMFLFIDQTARFAIGDRADT